MNGETTNDIDETDETAATMKVEVVDQLKTAISELESGERLTALTGGHGLQSRTFEFTWMTPTLAISFTMPYGRVLDDDETQQEDDANIGVACRLAILLIEADAAGSLLFKGEDSMSVSFDRFAGAHYHTTAADGKTIDSGSDWTGLIARFEHAFQSNGIDAMSIIWP